MIGQTYHDLTVISEERSGSLRCRCVCGNEVVVSACRLRTGRVRSCPECVQKRKLAHDLTGKIFGNLVVLRKSHIRNKWVVCCTCGNEEEVFTQMLKSGEKHQCAECTRRMRMTNLTGKTVDNLQVHNLVNIDGVLQWQCTCIVCGTSVVVKANYLLNKTKLHMCPACVKRETTKRLIARNKARTMYENTHPLYSTWRGMISRCTDKNSTSYKNYGGRGITVCDRWLGKEGFTNFVADMSPRPSKKHSLDRIDINGNYEPSNCKWATAKQQANNRRNNKTLTVHGITKTISEWAKHANVSRTTIELRLKRGMSPETAVLRGSLATKAGRQKLKQLGLQVSSNSKRHSTHRRSATSKLNLSKSQKEVLYKTWYSMHVRCENTKHPSYAMYGGKGIRVCPEWSGDNGFATFSIDMGPRPHEGWSLDRIDVTGNYCPSNCRWADTITQANNTTRNRRLTWNEKTLTVAQWARELDISSGTLYARLRLGWSVEKTLTTPKHHISR